MKIGRVADRKARSVITACAVGLLQVALLSVMACTYVGDCLTVDVLQMPAPKQLSLGDNISHAAFYDLHGVRSSVVVDHAYSTVVWLTCGCDAERAKEWVSSSNARGEPAVIVVSGDNNTLQRAKARMRYEHVLLMRDADFKRYTPAAKSYGVRVNAQGVVVTVII